MNIFSKVFFEGWTTKKGVKATTLPAQKEGQEPMSYAFVTLMQDRPYSLIAKDAKGNVLYESDGKTPRRTVPSDPVVLKFRNGSSQAIAKYKPEGMSRKIQGIGHIEVFQTTQNYVMVKGPDGKLTKRELFYYDSYGKRVDIEHVVTNTVIVVDEWQFADNRKEEASQNKAVTAQDMTAAIAVEDASIPEANDSVVLQGAIDITGSDDLPPIPDGQDVEL